MLNYCMKMGIVINIGGGLDEAELQSFSFSDFPPQ